MQTGTVDLRVPILTSQLSAGLWGTYRRAAHLFGLINAPGQGGPRAATLTTRGRDLAKALAASLLPHAHRNRHLQKGAVPLELVKRVDAGKTGKAPRTEEVRFLSEGMKGFDRGHSQALRRLRQSFDLHGALTLESLDPDMLTHWRSVKVSPRGWRVVHGACARGAAGESGPPWKLNIPAQGIAEPDLLWRQHLCAHTGQVEARFETL